MSSSKQKKKKICSQCKTKKSKYQCTLCRQTSYCSKNCQHLDWNEHKKVCSGYKNKKIKKKRKQKKIDRKRKISNESVITNPSKKRKLNPDKIDNDMAEVSTSSSSNKLETDDVLMKENINHGNNEDLANNDNVGKVSNDIEMVRNI